MRPSKRTPDQLRNIVFTRHFTKHAEGSVLVEFGDTKVICNASVVEGVPKFLKDAKQGWLTAEYGMLPRSTDSRMNREAARGKQGGRTVEIQRLIGRALRCALNLKALGEYTIHIDCDVIQADGGTRTAAISGACVAMIDALRTIKKENALNHHVAAVSVGIVGGTPVLDLDYAEDSKADTDMNVVMTDNGSFVEVQGTAEGDAFTLKELDQLLLLAKHGVEEIIEKQRLALQK